MKILTTIALLVLGVYCGVYAESATTGIQLDFEASQKLLAQQREEQLSVETGVGENVHALEKKLLKARRQSKLAMMSASARRELLKEVRAANRVLLDDAAYLSDIYDELSLQMSLAADPVVGDVELKKLSARSGSVVDLELKAESLDNAFDQIEALLGGVVTEAKAIGSNGQIVEGSSYSVGPVSWFLSSGGKDAGVLMHEFSGGLPRLSYEEDSNVDLLFKGESVELAVDVSGGKARAIAEIQSDPLELIRKGGVWLWPILFIAMISVFCGCMKFLQLAKIRDPDAQWVAGILSAVRSDDVDSARQIAQSYNHPAAEIISSSIHYISAGADVVEEVVYEHLIGVQSKLQKWLPFIAVTAATAPLLGLLGTVSGMIRMFNVITVIGTGDVKPMAGGISEALVTTLFGLVVAIPALILHTMLSRKSNGVVQNTEKLGLTFVNGLRKL